jgi:alpha-methylacyl-CoA racemase
LGFKVIEVVGLGAAPFCAMLLSDMGAEVIRVDRLSVAGSAGQPQDVLARGRRSIALDLKTKAGLDTLLRLAEQADVLFEGFRPGVAERLGFGPDECLERNPRLVYGRLTGWGQDGPLARAAGHDINYIALAGALHSIGRQGDKPVPPLNLVGDFGGGGLLLAFGMVCALLEAGKSGRGQVVDAAMIDGIAAQMAPFFGLQAAGQFPQAPGASLLGGAAPFYATYETADGRFIALGSLEPQFYEQLLELIGLDKERYLEAGYKSPFITIDRSMWAELRQDLKTAFFQKTRDEWCELMEGTDVCFAPVLSLSEAPRHQHHQARNTFVEIDGVVQNAPAPRFSRSQPGTPHVAHSPGADTDAVLLDWGFSAAEVSALHSNGGIVSPFKG